MTETLTQKAFILLGKKEEKMKKQKAFITSRCDFGTGIEYVPLQGGENANFLALGQ